MFFLGILSIQCKIRRDRPTETERRPVGDRDWHAGHSCII